MQYIPVFEVVVPENRQRQDFNKAKLLELCDSIAKPIGLMQPIVLRNDGKTLVAGERRLRAFKILNGLDPEIPHKQVSLRFNGEAVNPATIPFVYLDSLSPQQLVEAELEENVRRVDLSWQELALATKSLHDFRTTQNPKQTISDTANELHDGTAKNHEISETSDLLILAEFLDDPLIAGAKDLTQARKALKEEKKRVKRQTLAQTFNPESTEHTLVEGSCYENLHNHGEFAVIITDPPYGIDAHIKQTFDTTRHEYDDSDLAFQEVCNKLPDLAYGAAATDAHLYCFCDIRRFNELFAAFELSGWTVWNRPIIWDKGAIGSFGNSDYGFRACYEAILFARKGDRKFDTLYRDVINITQKTNNSHPAGKPVELFLELLKRSAYQGDRVADFYAGSGTIFTAAAEFGCTAVGWEINPKYIDMCKEAIINGK